MGGPGWSESHVGSTPRSAEEVWPGTRRRRVLAVQNQEQRAHLCPQGGGGAGASPQWQPGGGSLGGKPRRLREALGDALGTAACLGPNHRREGRVGEWPGPPRAEHHAGGDRGHGAVHPQPGHLAGRQGGASPLTRAGREVAVLLSPAQLLLAQQYFSSRLFASVPADYSSGRGGLFTALCFLREQLLSTAGELSLGRGLLFAVLDRKSVV